MYVMRINLENLVSFKRNRINNHSISSSLILLTREIECLLTREMECLLILIKESIFIISLISLIKILYFALHMRGIQNWGPHQQEGSIKMFCKTF